MSTEDEPTPVDIVIIGAGFAGIGMGIRLKRAGVDNFVILERAGEVGGTWRDNTYPGVACDVPAHLYSFSFLTKPDWSALFAPGAEIWQYLRDAAEDEGLRPHLRLNAEMTATRWDRRARLWRVTSSAGEFTARTVVLAAGRLSDPFIPELAGAQQFSGPMFHTSRWDHSADLTGKAVAVIGSGSSAVQVVPQLAKIAREVVLFSRSAPYVVPRGDRAYSAAEIRQFRHDPEAIPQLRSALFWQGELGHAQRLGLPAAVAAISRTAADHLARGVGDLALRERLTPDYAIGCKRIAISDDYYPALSAGGVTLEDSAATAISGGEVIAASGRRHRADAVVFATGYSASRPPYAGRVFGRAGHSLADHWAQGMRAYASTAVHGFPSLFVIDGPHAALGHNSAVYMIEVQIDFILGALAHRGSSPEPLEVSAAAEQRYVDRINSRAQGTVWLEGGCSSWYVDAGTGQLALLWPESAHRFRQANAVFDPAAFAPAAFPS